MMREADTLQAAIQLTKSEKPVRFISLGCSDGSEPYSAVILADNQLGVNKVHSHCQFEGVDYSNPMIRLAQGKTIALEPPEIQAIQSCVPTNGFSQYFQQASGTPPVVTALSQDYQTFPEKLPGYSWYTVQPFLADRVRFECRDVVDKLHSCRLNTSEQRVFLLRNIWTYFQQVARAQEVLAALKQALQPGDYVGIGELDLPTGQQQDIQTAFQKMGNIDQLRQLFRAMGMPYSEGMLQQMSAHAQHIAASKKLPDEVAVDTPALLRSIGLEPVDQASLQRMGYSEASGKLWQKPLR